jgi:adenine-specific DNA methylase
LWQKGLRLRLAEKAARTAKVRLAKGLIDAGFTITASWPVNTEAEGSLHIHEKSAARSTIFLACRVRETASTSAESRYWEEVEPQVRQAVRAKVKEFQDAGIGGIDLYLACFGPALQVFTEAWPLTRGTARPQPRARQRDLFEEFDPYAVRPEDALEAARREVKQWRMEQLATVKRQHHLDALTEWYVPAWDAFRAPRFPADEALKLARVVGLDFDQDVKKKVCEVKGDDVILWDSSHATVTAVSGTSARNVCWTHCIGLQRQRVSKTRAWRGISLRRRISSATLPC